MPSSPYTRTKNFPPFTKAKGADVKFEFDAVQSALGIIPTEAEFASGAHTFATAGGTANAITVANPYDTWTTYTGKDNYVIWIQITTKNTGAVTVNVDSVGAKSAKRNDGTALQSGDLEAGSIHPFFYDETNDYFVVPTAINGVLEDCETQATNAATSASNASTSETNAASSASAASTSASNASTSETNASSSATTATNYATKTDGFASGTDNSAKSWAIGGTGNGDPAAGSAKDWATTAEDTLVDGSDYSAKHYAAKAQLAASFAKITLTSATFEASVADGEAVYWDEGNIRYDEAIDDGTDKAEAVGLADVTNSTVYTAGLIEGLSGLTAGSTYYLSPSSAGALTTTPSRVKIGVAKSTTSLYLDIQRAPTVVVAPREKLTISATAATGTVAFNAITHGILYYTTNASGNWTLNVRGDATTSLDALMNTGESITVVFLATQGGTAYYQSGFQVDGTTVTPKWAGGDAPTAGNANSIDSYRMTVIKTGAATFTVLGEVVDFA